MADSEPPERQAGVSDVDLSGQTVLVTGSTNGIGRVAALAFGRLGARVLVHGRSPEAGDALVSEIDDTPGSARFLRADFADIEAVEGLAAEVRETVGTVDVLCNNAGGFFRDREPTSLGVDRAFHVNHLAHVRLTAALLDAIPAGGRVVTTSSVAHRVGTLDCDRVLDLSGLSPVGAYCRSKLANIQFTRELAARLDRAGRAVTANAFHPGIVPGSAFGRALPGPVSGLFDLFAAAPVAETVEDGAATMVYLAVSPAVADTTGRYFARCREIRPAPPARNDDATRELWERSADILEMAEPLAAHARA
jgi:NAD(P)-dependent dehydrogenase (short-subunit alcohol dehydrogenase family)